MAQENGAQKFVLSDINNTSACLDFVRLAPKYEIEPVLGVDFRNRAIQKFIGIAKNNRGFEALNIYLSEFLHSGDKFPDRARILPETFIVYPFSIGDVRFQNMLVNINPESPEMVVEDIIQHSFMTTNSIKRKFFS